MSGEELPAGWAEVRISDVCAVNPRDQHAPDGTSVSFIPMAAVNEVTGTIDAPEIRDVAEVRKGFTSFVDGDVIFAKITPCMENGKSAVAHGLVNKHGYGSTEFVVLRSNGAIQPRYLHQFVRQVSYRRAARQTMQSGVGQARVPKDFIEGTTLPLPPLPEQRRIVAKLDELRARSQKAREALDAVPALLEKLKQSVLAAAFRGDLTAEWRAAQAPGSVEPASVLLERIRAERRARWEQANPKKKYEEPEPVDTDGLPELPEGWCWARVDEVGAADLGKMRSPKDHNGPNIRPYLRVANVFEDRIDVTDVMTMNFTPAEFDFYQLRPGDILLNEGQSTELVGRPAMYGDELPSVAFTNSLVRYRPRGGVDPRFALFLFRHYMRSGRFARIAQITTNIAHLGATRFRALEFPVPPLLEQQEIVDRLGPAFAAIDALSATSHSSASDLNRLDQAILAKAFRGELVPQNPSDEPAEQLLARIQAEAAAPQAKRAGPTRRSRRPE